MYFGLACAFQTTFKSIGLFLSLQTWRLSDWSEVIVGDSLSCPLFLKFLKLNGQLKISEHREMDSLASTFCFCSSPVYFCYTYEHKVLLVSVFWYGYRLLFLIHAGFFCGWFVCLFWVWGFFFSLILFFLIYRHVSYCNNKKEKSRWDFQSCNLESNRLWHPLLQKDHAALNWYSGRYINYGIVEKCYCVLMLIATGPNSMKLWTFFKKGL